MRTKMSTVVLSNSLLRFAEILRFVFKGLGLYIFTLYHLESGTLLRLSASLVNLAMPV